MPFTLTMPKLSPTMEAGMITKWRKKVGDFVKAGDVLFEVATDKATVEHNALDEGYLRQILIADGQEAIVNQAIAIFTETKNESIEGYQAEGISPSVAPKAPVFTQEKEEQKVSPAVPLSSAGVFQPSFVPEPPLTHYVFDAPEGVLESRLRASPLARKLARQKGIDLTTVRGSGPQGRIVSRDVERGQPNAVAAFGRREVPHIAPGTYQEEPLTPMRKVIGQRLQESKSFIPHFYVVQEIDAEGMVSTHEHLKNMGIKVSYNDFVIRASALALREHPHVNSGFDSEKVAMIRFKTIDISIAVSVDAGLITPIIRHADYKNLGQISSEIKVLARKAREGKLQREEYFGGSFTISSLGMYGVSEFSGIINPPQAALLAVGAIEEKAVVRNGVIKVGKTLKITLSADHRVIDGVDAAKFLKTLQRLLENPSVLLI